MSTCQIAFHTASIRDAIETLQPPNAPNRHLECASDAYMEAAEFLLWAAEMASQGKMIDGTIDRTTLIGAARSRLQEAELAISSWTAEAAEIATCR